MRYLIATAASGCKDVSEFLEMPTETCEEWLEYCIRGPTEVRTQLLLAQLIQIVSGALGGQSLPIGRLLPWFTEITNEKPVDKKEMMMKRQRAVAASVVDAMVKKRGR